MLNKKEIDVMNCIFELCQRNNNSCIVSNDVIMDSCKKHKLTSEQVDDIVQQLDYDGYFDSTMSDKKGNVVHVITLEEKGKAFKRELVQIRRKILSELVMRMLFAALGAIVALIINKLLGN